MSEAAADRVAIAPGQALLARMEDVQHHVARLHELLRETYLPAALEARAATHAVETLADLAADSAAWARCELDCRWYAEVMRFPLGGLLWRERRRWRVEDPDDQTPPAELVALAEVVAMGVGVDHE